MRKLWAVSPNPTPHGMPIVGRFSNRDVPMPLGGLLEPDQVLVAARVADSGAALVAGEHRQPHPGITTCEYIKQRRCSHKHE